MMSLQEVDLNIVTIFRLSSSFQFSSSLKRKRDEFSSDKNKDTEDIFDALRSSVITLRVFNNDEFKDIYKKTDVKVNTVF